MAMKKADIEERIVLIKASISSAIANDEYSKVIELKAEMHALNTLLRRKMPATPANGGRRGRRPQKFNAIVERMKSDVASGTILENLKEEVLAAHYGASRDTCRKARAAVLANSVVN